LAAFVNALAMLALVAWIAWEAFSRIREPHQVQGMTVTLVAVIGLVINLIVAWLLSKDQKSVNTRAALVHVMGDLLGSVAALVAGLVISYTGWMMIDPILSIFVCVLVLRSTLDVLRESYHFLMQGVPQYINYLTLGEDLSNISGVSAVHDLHVWEMSPGEPALMGHVEVENLQDWPQTLARIRQLLDERYGIEHITLQAELAS
jgi:cobalt-zinc-cadmium efflux system protein